MLPYKTQTERFLLRGLFCKDGSRDAGSLGISRGVVVVSALHIQHVVSRAHPLSFRFLLWSRLSGKHRRVSARTVVVVEVQSVCDVVIEQGLQRLNQSPYNSEIISL